MSFTVDLSRLIDKAKGKTDLVVKKVMIEAFKGCVSKSPVDTGRFRGNWTVGFGNANRSTSEKLDTTKRGDKSGPTCDKLEYLIDGAKLDGKSIYLTNSLPYSLRLENGYSQQSPQGMVKITLMEISAKYGR